MEKAIQKAIEGGWGKETDSHPEFMLSEAVIQWYSGINSTMRHVVLDPLFWQALGKAEGWREDEVLSRFPESNNSSSMQPKVIKPGKWLSMQHALIDHIAEGKDVDSFFNNLLK